MALLPPVASVAVSVVVVVGVGVGVGAWSGLASLLFQLSAVNRRRDETAGRTEETQDTSQLSLSLSASSAWLSVPHPGIAGRPQGSGA